MNFSDDINIQKILFNKYNILGKLCYKSQQLNKINKLVLQSIAEINPDLAKFCIVANIDKNCLLIETTKSEFLTSLRFSSQEILSKLRQNPSLAQLITIKFRVNPELEMLMDINYAKKHFLQSKNNVLKSNTNKNAHNLHAKKLSQQTKDALNSIAKDIKSEELKLALEKLIQGHKD